jgi:hypothetical protein
LTVDIPPFYPGGTMRSNMKETLGFLVTALLAALLVLAALVMLA